MRWVAEAAASMGTEDHASRLFEPSRDCPESVATNLLSVLLIELLSRLTGTLGGLER
jgi:hypothetical protein